MPSPQIIEVIDEMTDGLSGFFSCSEPVAVYQLFLNSGMKRFGAGVVIRVGLATHADLEFAFIQAYRNNIGSRGRSGGSSHQPDSAKTASPVAPK